MMSNLTGTDAKLLLVAMDEIAAVNTDLSPTVWYMLSKNQDSLNNATKPLEDTRLKLVDKYGEKNEKGITSVPEDKINTFREDYQKVLDETIEVTLNPIKLSRLVSEMKSMKGVNNIYLFYQHLVAGDLPEEEAPLKKVEEEVPAEA